MNLAVVYGGTSNERKVSIDTGQAILDSLDNEKILSIQFDGDYNLLLNKLKSYKIDLVFNALHGGDGENGHTQLFFEKNNIRFTGSGSKASKIAMDKNSTKDLCIEYNIPTPSWHYIDCNNIKKENLDYRFLLGEYADSCVVKPANDGSSIGMTIIKNNISKKILKKAISNCTEVSKKIIIEEYVRGRELTVGILDNIALPVVEIFPKGQFYDYKSKYTKGQSDYFVPANLSSDLEKEIKGYALDINKIIGCKHYSRVDFLLGENNKAYLLEVNTLPGLTSTSLLPKAAKSAGLNYKNLINKIINSAND